MTAKSISWVENAVHSQIQVIFLNEILQIRRAHIFFLLGKSIFQIKLVDTKLIWHDHIDIIRYFAGDPMMTADGFKPPDFIGILKSNVSWAVRSNRESGDGYADILIKPKNPDTGIVIELKYARSFKELDQACERALEQIKDRRYDEALREDGRNEVLAYGIAFWKKRCKVVVDKI